MVDYLIVGAGFAGSVLAERIASQLNKKVLVVDRKNHIGGHAYDYVNEQGVLIHKYGPHSFHTNSRKVWAYLSRFTQWHPYQHRVRACIEDTLVPVPFNLDSLHKLFSPALARKYERLLIANFGKGQQVPILKLKAHPSPELRHLADYVYRNLFLGYTHKQWDMTPEQLDPSVTARIPLRISRDDRYHLDAYQGVPEEGYTQMFRRLLSHPNIEVLLNRDYKTLLNEVHFRRMIYTGPIDYYFDYLHGELPYRSLRFEFRNLQQEYYQPVAQVNYPNKHDYTRIVEYKHITGQNSHRTTVSYEYPRPHVPAENEPYYPIPRAENHERYRRYEREAAKLRKTVLFIGRLANYKYYNMDQIVAGCLALFQKEIAPRSSA